VPFPRRFLRVRLHTDRPAWCAKGLQFQVNLRSGGVVYGTNCRTFESSWARYDPHFTTRVVPSLHSALSAVQLDTCLSPSRHADVPHRQVPPVDAQQIVPLHVLTSSPTPIDVQEQESDKGFEQSKRPQMQSLLPWQQTTSPPIVAALHSRTTPTGGAFAPQMQKPSIGIPHGGDDGPSELSHATMSVATKKIRKRMNDPPASRT